MSTTDTPTPVGGSDAAAVRSDGEVVTTAAASLESDPFAADADRLTLLTALRDAYHERDRARDIAVALEQELARVARFHRPIADECAMPWCNACDLAWPCPTAFVLGLADGAADD